MINDKIIGMLCITFMYVATVIAFVYLKTPLDPAIEKLGSMIVTGIMGTVIGFNLNKPKPPPPPPQK